MLLSAVYILIKFKIVFFNFFYKRLKKTKTMIMLMIQMEKYCINKERPVSVLQNACFPRESGSPE